MVMKAELVKNKAELEGALAKKDETLHRMRARLAALGLDPDLDPDL